MTSAFITDLTETELLARVGGYPWSWAARAGRGDQDRNSLMHRADADCQPVAW
jgi:hypothetical protein